MKILKFKEAFIDQYGKLNDGTSNDEIEEFKKNCIERFKEKPINTLDNKEFYSLSLEFQDIYMKLCIEYKTIFDNEDLIIENIIEYYPEESKKSLTEEILLIINSNHIKNELPFDCNTIDLLNDEFQKLIINTIINNADVYYLHENQFNAFNSNNKKTIERYRDIIKVY